jgi:hypothetical protein
VDLIYRAKCAASTEKHGIGTSNTLALALHGYALMMDVAGGRGLLLR